MRRFNKLVEIISPILYFVAMTVIMTWPLIKYMRTSVVGQLGDNIYFIWLIDWFRRALFELHVSPITVPFLNYPEGWSIAYTEITHADIFLALPFDFIGGPTFAYNSAMMLTFILTGWGTYLWVRRLTGSSGAGLIAGTIFAFTPYKMAHFLIGHLNLSGTQWFPFYFMGLYDLLEARKWDWKPVLLSAVSLGLIGMTSQYYLYMTLFISGIFVIGYFIFVDHKLIINPGFWARIIAFGLLAVPLLWIGNAPYLEIARQGGMPVRDISMAQRYSAHPTDFILPSPDHVLWGKWTRDTFDRNNWVEGSLYFGVIAAALAIIAVVKRRQMKQNGLVKIFVLTALCAIILAMGINLNWFGEPVVVQLPGFLQQWTSRESFNIPLPGKYLFNYFPYYSRMRALERFGVFALFSSSILAGLGAAWLLKGVKRDWTAWVTLLLIGLVFLDFYPGPYTSFAEIKERPVDNWLANQPDGLVAQFPFWEEESQENIYYTMIHGKPFLGGFFNAFPPPQYTRLKPVMETFPSEESAQELRDLDVKYILVDTTQYKNMEEIQRSMEDLGFKLVTIVGDQYVFSP